MYIRGGQRAALCHFLIGPSSSSNNKICAYFQGRLRKHECAYLLISKKKQDSGREDVFFYLHRFLVKKTGLCGREDSALSAVRPSVDIRFLEMALVLKRLPTLV